MNNDPFSDELLKVLIEERKQIIYQYEIDFQSILEEIDRQHKEFIEKQNKIKNEAIRQLQNAFEENLKLTEEKIKALTNKDSINDIFQTEKCIKSYGKVYY